MHHFQTRVRSVDRSELIYITLNNGQLYNSVKIPDQPFLRQPTDGTPVKRVQGLEVLTNADVPYNPITGNAVATFAQVQNMSLIAYFGDPINESDKGNYINYMPLTLLHTLQNNSNDAFEHVGLWFNDLVFQWEKCSIVFNPPLTPGAATDILINVFYTSRTPHATLVQENNAKHAMHGLTNEKAFEHLASEVMALRREIAHMRGGAGGHQALLNHGHRR